MFKSEKKPIRNDENSDYRRICNEAYEKYPDDRIRQLEYVKKNGTTQFYAMLLLQIAQSEFSLMSNSGKVFKFEGGILDYLFRGYLDAVRHMQTDLPDGVHDYICDNLDGFVLQALKQTDKYKGNPLLKDYYTAE